MDKHKEMCRIDNQLDNVQPPEQYKRCILIFFFHINGYF